MSGIQSIKPTDLLKQLDAPTGNKGIQNSEKGDQPNFAGMVKNFLESVNQDEQTSSQMAQEVVQGKSDNLVEPMVALEQSQLSFQLMLEIRNKIMESLSEIQRMPV